MKKKAVIIAAAVVLFVIAGFIYSRLGNDQDTYLAASGIVEGTEVNISSKVPGRISEICCREGEGVTPGSIVIKLESDELDASVKQAEAGVARAGAEIKVMESSVEAARANIESVEADIRNAEAVVERSRVGMEEARREMERAKSLFAEQIMSNEAYEKAVAGYDIRMAEYDSAKAGLSFSRSKQRSAAAQLETSFSQLTAAQKGLKEAEANLLYQRSRFNDTMITSPIAGTVVFRAFEEGETITPGVTVLTIVDMDNLYVRLDIDETRIGGVVLGKEADITLEGLPGRVIKGRIMEVGRYAEFATQRDVVRGRQDIRTFRVKIDAGDHGGVLKPGMTVSVSMPR